MTIPTQMSLHGFIATAPELNFTGKGARPVLLPASASSSTARRSTGRSPSSTRSSTTWCCSTEPPSGPTPRFKAGDQFVASGYIHEYEQERPTVTAEIREQFVARRIGHDCARTRYVVDRTPAQQPEPPTNELTVVNEPRQAVGI